MTRPRSLVDRFWDRVARLGDDDCWQWLGSPSTSGYGKLWKPGGGEVYAHRLSYSLRYGPIPEGLVIDHICHNTMCVNPHHLQAVTHKQNLENMSGAHRDSRSGVRGVHWNKNARKWQGLVRHNNHSVHVGYFDQIDVAEAAVIAKRNELFTNNLGDRR